MTIQCAYSMFMASFESVFIMPIIQEDMSLKSIGTEEAPFQSSKQENVSDFSLSTCINIIYLKLPNAEPFAQFR